MPIEIRELIIRLSAREDEGEPGRSGKGRFSPEELAEDLEEVIREEMIRNFRSTPELFTGQMKKAIMAEIMEEVEKRLADKQWR